MTGGPVYPLTLLRCNPTFFQPLFDMAPSYRYRPKWAVRNIVQTRASPGVTEVIFEGKRTCFVPER